MKNIFKLIFFFASFYHVFFSMGAIDQLPPLFGIWCDPKPNITMYRKEFLKDWSSSHLVDYWLYINCFKENISTSEFSLREKNELGF
jgi:hypothetical protein